MDLLCFFSVVCLLSLCARLFICAFWSPAGKGLTSLSRLWCLTVSLSLSFDILGQVWYLIVSIPDLCTFTYFQYQLSLNSGQKWEHSLFAKPHKKDVRLIWVNR